MDSSKRMRESTSLKVIISFSIEIAKQQNILENEDSPLDDSTSYGHVKFVIVWLSMD